MNGRLRKLTLGAVLAALCCAATFAVKLPTPTMGYIHPGDAVVLLCAFWLGPLWGALAAGLGSLLADLLGGYLFYAPATFVIKAATAALAAFCLGRFRRANDLSSSKKDLLALLISGALGELLMVAGYFLFEIFLLAAEAGSGLSATALSAGAAAALSGIPFNLVQGAVGVALAALLCPVLSPAVRRMLSDG